MELLFIDSLLLDHIVTSKINLLENEFKVHLFVWRSASLKLIGALKPLVALRLVSRWGLE